MTTWTGMVPSMLPMGGMGMPMGGMGMPMQMGGVPLQMGGMGGMQMGGMGGMPMGGMPMGGMPMGVQHIVNQGTQQLDKKRRRDNEDGDEEASAEEDSSTEDSEEEDLSRKYRDVAGPKGLARQIKIRCQERCCSFFGAAFYNGQEELSCARVARTPVLFLFYIFLWGVISF